MKDRMKQSALSMAAMALLMTGCSQNELYDSNGGGITSQDPNIITFQSVVGTTRANDATFNTLTSDANGFNVVALKKDGTALFTGTPADGTADDKTIAYAFDNKANPNAWKWLNQTEDKKWPTDPVVYPLTFFASYPSYDNDNGEHVLDNNSRISHAFSIDETIANQTDWLAARTVENTKPANGMTPLLFKHILSNICFQIATPTGYKVYVQSVRIVNVAKEGRSYDFKAGKWLDEPQAYTSLGNYTYFESTTAKMIIGNGAGVALDGTDGNTLKLLPQGTAADAVPAWDNSDQGFKKGAKAWAEWVATDNATKIAGWYDKDYSDVGSGAESGMKIDGANAKAFWAGARIEVVYRLEDAAGNSVIGRKANEAYQDAIGNSITAPAGGLFIRVGYPLNLSSIKNENSSLGGWLAGYKYTYTLNIGTPSATNGTLLDPTYKQENGTDDNNPVDNPKVNPSDPITKDGYIMFDVDVDRWIENTFVNII